MYASGAERIRAAWWLPLACAVILGGCGRGDLAGVGAGCDERRSCRSFLTCVDGRCRNVDPPSPDAAPDALKVDGLAGEGLRDVNDPPRDAPADAGEPPPDGPRDAADAPRDVAESPRDVAADAVPPVFTDPTSSPQVFAFLAAPNGGVWHSRGIYDNARAPWPEFAELTAQLGNIGAIADLDGLQVGPEILLLARTGTAWHQAARLEGRWTPWTRRWTGHRSIGLARSPEGPLACWVDAIGRFGLAVRRPDGSWENTAPVTDLAVTGPGTPQLPTFVAVDCAWATGELHFLLVDDHGRLWHTGKRVDSWRPLAQLAVAPQIKDVDAAGLPGELHVMAATSEKQYHSIRLNDGSWQDFWDYGATQMSPPGALRGTTITGLLDTLHVGWLAESGGLYHSLRWNYIYWQPFRHLALGGVAAFSAATLVGFVY